MRTPKSWVGSMRNPLNSWEKSDSEFEIMDDPTHDEAVIVPVAKGEDDA